MTIADALCGYPGRGLVVRSEHGGVGWAYFVTGRSVASRRRRVSLRDGRAFIEPIDTAGETDPLRHYACACPALDNLVVGNGEHVEQVADALTQGRVLDEALSTVEPEPDSLQTPRIGAVVAATSALAFRVFADQARVVREVRSAPSSPRDILVLTTYDGSLGDPVACAPVHHVADSRPFPDIVRAVWSTLGPELRVLALAGVGTSLGTCWTLSDLAD